MKGKYQLYKRKNDNYAYTKIKRLEMYKLPPNNLVDVSCEERSHNGWT